MLTWRATIDCVPSRICAPTVIGSTPSHGRAPWVCLPVTFSVHSSTAAMVGPARTPMSPTCRLAQTCRPSTASGLKSRNRPSSIISFAPAVSPAVGGPSSAGWNTNITSPGRSAFIFDSASATPSRIATCMSWPQACITPTGWPRYVLFTVEANGNPVCSVTGSASMSARSAMRGPGLPPFRMATTPVWPMPVFGSSPNARSLSATICAVRVSWLPSSGCWWKSRRHATMSARSACAAAATSGRWSANAFAGNSAARARESGSRRMAKARRDGFADDASAAAAQAWCSRAKYSDDCISTRREAQRSNAGARRSPAYSAAGAASAVQTRLTWRS